MSSYIINNGQWLKKIEFLDNGDFRSFWTTDRSEAMNFHYDEAVEIMDFLERFHKKWGTRHTLNIYSYPP